MLMENAVADEPSGAVAGRQEAVKTLAAGALTLLAGCTPPPRFGVVNETPLTVTLHLDGDPGTLGWQEKVVLLQAGEERSFRAGTMFNSGFLRFRIGACDYEYDWQDARRRSEKGALLGVIVQLENGHDGASPASGGLQGGEWAVQVRDARGDFCPRVGAPGYIAAVSGCGAPETAASARV